MFVTLRIILKNIMKGVILSFRSFFSLFIVFSNPGYGSEATGEKAEFNYFPIFMEYFVKHARIQRAYENNLLIYYREEKEVLNTLFLEGVPDERQNVACSRFRD